MNRPYQSLIRLSAVEAARRVHAGDVKPSELVEAAISRIEEVDVHINALPIRCFERARNQARAIEERRRRGDPGSLLGGLPVAVKDNTDVAGVRSTMGTPIFSERIAMCSDPAIVLLEANGGITVGKSNLSELGGANTFNAVHGATRNPWNTDLSVSGSSGGSAAALASGQVWLAHGNDLGGSLRTPASFCSVVSIRPTPGRVPRKPMADPFDTQFVEGAMGRSVADSALLLDALAGAVTGDPLSTLPADGPFLTAAESPAWPQSIAFSPDLALLPVEREVISVCRRVLAPLAAAGVEVEESAPDLPGALDTVLVLRGATYASAWEPMLAAHHDHFILGVLGDIERGLAQSGAVVTRAMRHRAELFRRMAAFLNQHEFLICPAAQTLPFPVGWDYPHEIEGVAMKTYIDWIAITAILSMFACPIVTLPVGFTKDGLPVGVQIVGPPRSEARLLAFASALEDILALPKDPIDPREPVRHTNADDG
jgi:amidase